MRARIDKLEDGVYRVLSRKKGYAPALFEFVVLRGDTQKDITLEFATGDHEKEVYFENPQSMQRSMAALQAAIPSLQANKFAEAESQLKIAIQLYPSSPDAHINLGIAEIQQQKWEPAKASLQKAVSLSAAMAIFQTTADPTAPNPYQQMNQRAQLLLRQLPAIELRMAGGELLQQKKFAEAIAKYEEALKHIPTDADTFYNIALCYAQLKQFAPAAENIQQDIEILPGEQAYQALQKQINGLKQIANAEQAQGYLKEGDDLYNKGDFGGAVAKYEEACALLQPENQAKVMTQIAQAHEKAEQMDQAQAAHQKAIQLDPENTELTKNLALFYVGQKKYDEALNLYTGGAGAGGAGADEALLNLGKELAQEGNSEVAQLALEKAVEANPQNAEAHYELGMLYYFSKEDDARAKELFTKYIEIGEDQGHLDNSKNFLVVIEKRSKP
jgi:tetratricopeptide (TPR) repeat protein